ncbi:unnamed protein product [Rhizophagus irregularis]|nr:unnamed protein product [Rhizophagus irregularis]CAB5204330.1 unnamed protein product [Rhizophagus irregularis]
MNDLIREFEEIVTDELNLIRNESIVALKHVATGKYLSSIENIHYTTGSKSQVAFIQHIDYYKYLGINSGSYKSPISEHTEVSCGEYYHTDWKVNHSRLENSQRYLKSNDVVNLSTKKFYDNNELVCHNERLGGNDEWCIELIKQD